MAFISFLEQEHVRPVTAGHKIIAGSTKNVVIAASAIDSVVAGPAVKTVDPVVAKNLVVEV